MGARSRLPLVSLGLALLAAPVLGPVLGHAPGHALGQETPQDGARLFREEVLPLLERRCFECHGPGSPRRGGLALTSRGSILAGGDRGPAVDLEERGQSFLLAMIAYSDEDRRMPPSGKLPADELALLTRWVEAGIPWSSEVTLAEPERPRSTRRSKGDGREGWSYRPPTRPELSAVANGGWVRNPVDAFVLARLEAAGLQPTPQADRHTLIRRATYDLTGLPPTPAEIEAFLADPRSDAWERLVERLLASPQYGEHWGRHWLDVVRYAETNGYERDSDKPYIWRYRDWVIDAFNADVPYDRFVVHQLAGDELDEVTRDSIVATGYQRLMLWDDEPGMGVVQGRYDVLDDLVRTTGEAFLGMTLGCARCHDHKGDPIEQVDYYSFMAFFHGITDVRIEGNLVEIPTPEERATHERAVVERREGLERRTRELSELEQLFRLRAAGGRPTSGMTDVTYRLYTGHWEALPDFDALTPQSTGALVAGLFDLSPATGEHDFGFVFEGRLQVPRSGDYSFQLDSDDGARLTVGGRTLVERDGVHGLGETQVGTIHLEAGSVPVRLDYFQGKGGSALDLTWGRARDDRWRYTLEDPGPGWQRPDFDDSSWAEGPGGFGVDSAPAARVGTEWTSDDVWLRRTFEWDAGDGAELALVAHHDDDLDVHLNGVEALRRKRYTVRYEVFEPAPEARAAVRRGSNTLAVHCRHTAGDQFVHVRPVRRADTPGTSLADLAAGRLLLSASAETDHRVRIAKVIESQGVAVLGQETFERWFALRGQRELLARRRPVPLPAANAVSESGPHPRDLHVHVRGNASVHGERVEPRFPPCLDPPPAVIPEPQPDAASSGRRRVLAEWIASADNPLTARVMVNRIWQHHFGRGIVPTPNDFGELGERPTHPALLDWLASELMERGWSVKDMHRLVMGSATYRAGYRPAGPLEREVDPGNDLLWRFRMRRLSAEELRDTILAMTGRLSLEMGGPSFFAPMPAEYLATSSRPEAVWGISAEEQTYRRSVYIVVKRSLRPPLLETFDLADRDSSCPVRFTTTQPAQALALLNSEFVNDQAARFAERLRADAGPDRAQQVRRAVWLALGREASQEELAGHLAFMDELERDFGLDPEAVLVQFCLLVLNLNEFIYLD